MSSIWSFLSLFTKDNIVIAFLLAILIGIGYIIYFVATARSQLNNHLPTQINDLKESQKEIKSEIKALSHLPTAVKGLKDNQKEIKDNIKALNQKIEQTNQKIDQNYKDMTTQNIQNFKDMTTQNNQNFKELVSLITKQRTG